MKFEIKTEPVCAVLVAVPTYVAIIAITCNSSQSTGRLVPTRNHHHDNANCHRKDCTKIILRWVLTSKKNTMSLDPKVVTGATRTTTDAEGAARVTDGTTRQQVEPRPQKTNSRAGTKTLLTILPSIIQEKFAMGKRYTIDRSVADLPCFHRDNDQIVRFDTWFHVVPAIFSPSNRR